MIFFTYSTVNEKGTCPGDSSSALIMLNVKISLLIRSSKDFFLILEIEVYM